MDAVRDIGCIVCLEQYGGYRPATIHHCEGKTKPAAHYSVLPLCYEHHQGGGEAGMFISRHPWKARFEEAYGSEDQLKQNVQAILGGTERKSA